MLAEGLGIGGEVGHSFGGARGQELGVVEGASELVGRVLGVAEIAALIQLGGGLSSQLRVVAGLAARFEA